MSLSIKDDKIHAHLLLLLYKIERLKPSGGISWLQTGRAQRGISKGFAKKIA